MSQPELPTQSGWGPLARLGIGPRVLKTAIAAGAAWWFSNVLGEPLPVFAAVAAILGLDTTVIGSLRRVGELLLGMLAGLVLAAFVIGISGSEPLTVALLVLLAMATGAKLRLQQAVTVEFAISALLVVAYTDPARPYFGITRVWECLLGGAVAVIVNALVLPPAYIVNVRRRFQGLLALTIASLRFAIDDLVDAAEPSVVSERLTRLDADVTALTSERDTLARARDALRFSPIRRKQREAVLRHARGSELLEQVLGHSLGAVRVAWQHVRRQPRPSPMRGGRAPDALVLQRDATVRALAAYAVYLESGSPPDLTRFASEVGEIRESRSAFLAAAELDLQQAGELQSRVDIAAAESELEHIMDDLTNALADEQRALADLSVPAAT